MARKGHIISVVMDNSSNHSDEIQLQDRGGDNFFQKVEKKLLESMGKRGLFDQHVFNMSLHLTIVKFPGWCGELSKDRTGTKTTLEI